MSSMTPPSENSKNQQLLNLQFASVTPPHKLNTHVPALDHVRALGVLLVIALHCGTPYITHKMQLLVWPLHDANPSPVVDAVVWWIECFIMPLFLVLSGFVTDQLLQRKGAREFFQNRKRKLLFPLLLASVFILPFDLYVWTSGLVVEGGYPEKVLQTFKFYDPVIDDNLWGLSHLWYLEYIFLYGCGWAYLNRKESQWSISGSDNLQLSRAFLYCMIAMGVAILCWAPEVVLGFQHRPWPVPSKFLYSGLFFFGGVWLNRQPNPLRLMQQWGPVALCCSACFFTIALPLIHQEIGTPTAGLDRLLLATTIVGVAVCSCVGIIGSMLKWANFKIPAVGYIAAASFWMYLIHHPLVGASQIVLAKTELNAVSKTMISWCSVTGVTLLTFELFVRKTRVNGWLGGVVKKPASYEPVPDSETLPPEQSRAA